MLQYQIPLMAPFGLAAYGCCEDLTPKIDLLRQIPNLRRIAVSPMADVARSSLLLSAGSLPPEIPRPVRWLLSAVRRRFHDLYLQHYLSVHPGDRKALEAWRPLIAAARLSENIEEEQSRLIAKVEAGLSRR